MQAYVRVVPLFQDLVPDNLCILVGQPSDSKLRCFLAFAFFLREGPKVRRIVQLVVDLVF